MSRRRRLLVALSSALLTGGLVLCAAAVWLAESLTRPAVRAVGPPPPDLPAETVRIDREDGGFVSGWLVRGKPEAGAVLLLHPVRSDRRSMLGRARFLRLAGHTVLLIDMQAHGESPGVRIGFGSREARDVEAALSWLADRVPGVKVGVVGVSLGGAAAAMARPRVQPTAMVLESVYPDMGAAVGNRLRLHLADRPGGKALAALLEPLLLVQARLWTGASADRLQPAAALAGVQVPLLLISGQRDRHTTAADTVRLHRGAGPRAELWLLPQAAHEDLHAHAREAYEMRVGGFLASHVGTR